jgi:hypothetical protein
MSTSLHHRLIGVVSVCMFATLAVTAGAAPADKSGRPGRFLFPPRVTAAEAIAQVTGTDGALRFEIAEDGTRFDSSSDSKHADGIANGDSFVSYGYIYPAGTIVDGADGVNANGSPEFPSKVLGLWASYGWNDWPGADSTTGPSTLSIHVFNFGNGWGNASLVTEGYPLAENDVPMSLAITGGTGPYAGQHGEILTTNLGLNETEGGNGSFEVHFSD